MKRILLILVWMIFSYSMSATQSAITCVDPLEPNNNINLAFNLGTSTGYNNPDLCLTAEDEDWLKFSFNGLPYYILIKGYNNSVEGAYGLSFNISGNTVTIETYEMDGSTDTKMILYNSGFGELAFNDDGGSGYFSRIVYEIEDVSGCVDPLEPNEYASQSRRLGAVTSYNNPDLCLSPADHDWLSFWFNDREYWIRIIGYNASTEGAYGLDFNISGNSVTIETYETNGSTDTKLYLYGPAVELITTDDDGGEGYFSRIVYEFEEGDCVDPLEPNSSSSLAFDLGTMTSFDNPNLCLTPDDSDWLKFTYTGETYYIKVMGYNSSVEGAYGLNFNISGSTLSIETYETEGIIDTKLYLFNPDMSQTSAIAFNDDGGTNYCSRIVYELRDGEACVDRMEPNDQASESRGIGAPSFNYPYLCLTPGDNDWFTFTYNDHQYWFRITGYDASTEGAYGLKFYLSPDKTLTIETYETNGSTDTKLYLYGVAVTLMATDDDGGEGYFSRIVYEFGDCFDPREPNDSQVDASGIWPDGSYINSDLCLTPGDRDWFIFSYADESYFFLIEGYNAMTEGAYGLDFAIVDDVVTIETFETDGSTDTKIYLYKWDTGELAFNDDGGVGYFSLLTYTFPSPILDLSVNSPPINAMISPPGESDWYKFETLEGGPWAYIIETQGNMDTYMYLYRGDQTTLVDQNDDGGVGYNSRLVIGDYPYSWYFVKIKGYSSTATGSYSISLTGQWPDSNLQDESMQENAMGNEELGLENISSDLFVYPNPAENRIFVRLPKEKENLLRIEILNQLGQQTWMKPISLNHPDEEIINVEHLAPGMYYIRLYTSEGVITSKFVRNNR